MPHFKCVACETRLFIQGGPADEVGDLCPGCGLLLEPVGELSEIVGFQSIKPRDGADGRGAPGRHQGMAGRVQALMARREAILAQAAFDADRWLDDGGSFSSEALAETMALPAPRREDL